MYVSIRDCMLPVMGKPSPCEALAELGLASVEIAVGKDTKVGWVAPDGRDSFMLSNDKDVAALKEALKKQRVGACALLMGNDFSSEDFDGEVKALITTCKAAEAIGVPAVRVDMLPHTKRLTDEEFMKACGKAMKLALRECSKVRIGVENHGSTSNRPEFLERVFGDVGDERFGLTLDTGNFYWYGHPLEQVYMIMEKYANRVHHTHIKNISYPKEMRNTRREVGYKYGEYVCPIYQGDIDHKRVVAILRKAGYGHGLCIEDESLGKFSKDEQKTVLKKNVEHLKSVL